MLTRIEIDGFKNLSGVDLHFGPFTCVVGYNAVGKSNLFDAIVFMSHLADRSFGEAAEMVRGTEHDRVADPKDLFWSHNDQQRLRMRLAAEMLVSEDIEDDLGQTGKATITFLRYEIELGYEEAHGSARSGRISLLSERLSHITQGDAGQHLPFPHSASRFRGSVVRGRRAGKEFISTEGSTVQVHQDGGSRGRPLPASTTRASTSVLSTIRTIDSPTILAARREMQGWSKIALEPTAMRAADDFRDKASVGADGRHLPATLFRIAHQSGNPHATYERVVSRLNDLVGLGIKRLWVEEDRVRERFTLHVEERSGVVVPARSLSEGTLRFLALCTMLEDTTVKGVLCMEEPENGLHPENIPAMIDLLSDLAVDPNESPGDKNPFRQVLVNTHAPAVVDRVRDDDLLVARYGPDGSKRPVRFLSLQGTWRALAHPNDAVGRAVLGPYATPYTGQLRFDFDEAS